MFCDFHTHLHQYTENDPSLDQIKTHNIISIASSVDYPSFQQTKKTAQKSKLIIPTFGVHPFYADTPLTEKDFNSALNDSLLIGEIGLDFFWAKNIERKTQEKMFIRILDHCHLNRKYCVVHTKGAEKRVLEILSDFPDAKPVIHWYHGPEKYFDEILNRGFFCTFGVEIFYSRFIRKLLKKTPLNLLLTETDNPESDIWLGGSRKDPLLIAQIVNEIAAQKKLSSEELNHIVLENSLRILTECGWENPTGFSSLPSVHLPGV